MTTKARKQKKHVKHVKYLLEQRLRRNLRPPVVRVALPSDALLLDEPGVVRRHPAAVEVLRWADAPNAVARQRRVPPGAQHGRRPALPLPLVDVRALLWRAGRRQRVGSHHAVALRRHNLRHERRVAEAGCSPRFSRACVITRPSKPARRVSSANRQSTSIRSVLGSRRFTSSRLVSQSIWSTRKKMPVPLTPENQHP